MSNGLIGGLILPQLYGLGVSTVSSVSHLNSPSVGPETPLSTAFSSAPLCPFRSSCAGRSWVKKRRTTSRNSSPRARVPDPASQPGRPPRAARRKTGHEAWGSDVVVRRGRESGSRPCHMSCPYVGPEMFKLKERVPTIEAM